MIRESASYRAFPEPGETSGGVVSDAPLANSAEALGHITTAALARVLGKGNARAARDWCQRHQIPYRRDGKHNWVRVADVKRVLDNLPVHTTTRSQPRDDAASAAVAAITGRR